MGERKALTAANFSIREATIADIPALAHHRTAMFLEMGRLSQSTAPAQTAATIAYLNGAVPSGEYRAWVAVAGDKIIAGAGLQFKNVLPFPAISNGGRTITQGRSAVVVNVYTEPEWRRRGVAQEIMRAVIAYAQTGPLDRLVLHASDDGRALYEKLGFIATNEMRFPLDGNR